MGSTRNTLWRTLVAMLMVSMGLLAGVTLIEFGFRIYYRVNPSMARGFFWRPSALYGWEHVPDREGVWHDAHGEFRTIVRINEQGLRDVDHTYEKPAGVYRILVLGDSYVEGVQVQLEDLFARHLERNLNSSGQMRVEVINAGVADYGTDAELLWMRSEGLRYQPDLVLLGFTLANDVRNNYEPLNLLVPIGSKAKPVFSLGNDGALLLRPAPPVPSSPPWWYELHVGRAIADALGWRPALAQPPPRTNNAPQSTGVPVDAWIYDPATPVKVDDAWRLTFALLLAMRANAAAVGARFAVFAISGPWVHDWNQWKQLMSADKHARDTWDPRRPNRILAEFLRKHGIPELDLVDAFDGEKDNAPLFFARDKHWTPVAHRIAARAVAEFLVAQGLVPTSSP